MTFETDDSVETTATENTGVEVETEQTDGGEQQPEQEQEVEQTEAQKQEEAQKAEKAEKKSRYAKRVQELNARALEAERKLAELESKANQAQASTKPKIEDFDDYGEYEDALEQFRINQAEAKVLAKINEQKTQESLIQKQVEFQTALVELEDEGIDVQALTEKANTLPPLPIQLDQFGLGTKETLKLASKLLSDDDLYFELSQMNPIQAAVKIGRLIDSNESKPKPKVSKAPPPIKPVQANAPASRSVDSLSDEEFLAERRKQRLKG